MGEAKQGRWTLVVAFIATLLGSGVISNWVVPTAWSTLYACPNFEIVVPPDLSSVEIRNTGHAAATNAKISIRVSGNKTLAFTFSSENSTAATSYSSDANSTLVTLQLKRMAQRSLVSVTFKSYGGQTLEVWIHSDEKGAYEMAKRGIGVGQPAGDISQIFVTIVVGVRDNLLSVQFYMWLILLLFLTSRVFKIDYRQLLRPIFLS